MADLVHADHHQPVQTAAIELSATTRARIFPTDPADPHQAGHRRRGHLLSKERRTSSKSRVYGGRPGPTAPPRRCPRSPGSTAV